MSVFARAPAGWDVSDVTDMSYMLAENGASADSYYYSMPNDDMNAQNFNAIISAWDVSSVTDMFGILRSCGTFNHIV